MLKRHKIIWIASDEIFFNLKIYSFKTNFLQGRIEFYFKIIICILAVFNLTHGIGK